MITRSLERHLILSWTKQTLQPAKHQNYSQARSKQMKLLNDLIMINTDHNMLLQINRDTHTYLKYHHEQCIGAIADYLGQISQLLDTLQRDAKAEGGENASDGKAIFLGRLTRGIALTSTDLLDAFTHTAPNNGVQYTTALPRRADRGKSSLFRRFHRIRVEKY